MASDKKKQQKAAFGLQDSDEEEENDIDAEIESMLAPKKSVKQVAAAGTKVVPVVTPVVPVVAAATAVPVSNDKLDAARRLAAKLAGNMPATSTPSASSSAAAAAVLMGESISETSVLHRKAIAEQMAERLQAKLGYTPRDISDDGSDSSAAPPIPSFGSSAAESFQRFEEEFGITSSYSQTVMIHHDLIFSRHLVGHKKMMSQLPSVSSSRGKISEKRDTRNLPQSVPVDRIG